LTNARQKLSINAGVGKCAISTVKGVFWALRMLKPHPKREIVLA